MYPVVLGKDYSFQKLFGVYVMYGTFLLAVSAYRLRMCVPLSLYHLHRDSLVGT